MSAETEIGSRVSIYEEKVSEEDVLYTEGVNSCIALAVNPLDSDQGFLAHRSSVDIDWLQGVFNRLGEEFDLLRTEVFVRGGKPEESVYKDRREISRYFSQEFKGELVYIDFLELGEEVEYMALDPENNIFVCEYESGLDLA